MHNSSYAYHLVLILGWISLQCISTRPSGISSAIFNSPRPRFYNDNQQANQADKVNTVEYEDILRRLISFHLLTDKEMA